MKEIERLSFGAPPADDAKSLLMAVAHRSRRYLPTRAPTRPLPEPVEGYPGGLSRPEGWKNDFANLSLSGREDLNLRPFGPELAVAASQPVPTVHK
jgi:hypothetical protein